MKPALYRFTIRPGRQSEVELPLGAAVTGASLVYGGGPVSAAVYLVADRHQQKTTIRRFTMTAISAPMSDDMMATSRGVARVTNSAGVPTDWKIVEITR